MGAQTGGGAVGEVAAVDEAKEPGAPMRLRAGAGRSAQLQKPMRLRAGDGRSASSSGTPIDRAFASCAVSVATGCAPAADTAGSWEAPRYPSGFGGGTRNEGKARKSDAAMRMPLPAFPLACCASSDGRAQTMEFTTREMLDAERINIWDAVELPGGGSRSLMGVNLGCPGASVTVVGDHEDRPASASAALQRAISRGPGAPSRGGTSNLANSLSLASCGPGNIGESLSFANCNTGFGDTGDPDEEDARRKPDGSGSAAQSRSSTNARRALTHAAVGSGPRIVAYTADGGFIGAKDSRVLEDGVREDRNLIESKNDEDETEHLAGDEATKAHATENQRRVGAADAPPRRV